MLVSYKNQKPQPIPNRIRLSDGTTRTDHSTFTQEEIEDAGYTEVQPKPIVTNSQVVAWDSTLITWKVRDKTAEELESELTAQWAVVRQQRDRKIQSIAWLYERYNRNSRLGITQLDDINALDQYVQSLANLPQTQTDPFNIVWPSLTQEIDNASII